MGYPPSIEYNAAGALLLTLRNEDMWSLLSGLHQAGFDSICMLPFRALAEPQNVKYLRESPVKVNHLEDAWNPTHEDNILAGMFASALHKKRVKDVFQRKPEKQPTKYWDGLFPSEATCQNIFEQMRKTVPTAKFISHRTNTDLDPSAWLLEVHPGLNMNAQEILVWSEQNGVNLVFDPSHLLPSTINKSFPGRPIRSAQEWEKQFNTLSQSGRVEVVDIQGDIGGLLNGKGELAELTAAAKKATGVQTLRVEVPIPATKQIPGIEFAQKRGFRFLAEIAIALRVSH